LKCDQYPCRYRFTTYAIKRKRTTFKPDELADTFVSLKREKRVDGLVLELDLRRVLLGLPPNRALTAG
jgi:hypothetical protein